MEMENQSTLVVGEMASRAVDSEEITFSLLNKVMEVIKEDSVPITLMPTLGNLLGTMADSVVVMAVLETVMVVAHQVMDVDY